MFVYSSFHPQVRVWSGRQQPGREPDCCQVYLWVAICIVILYGPVSKQFPGLKYTFVVLVSEVYFCCVEAVAGYWVRDTGGWCVVCICGRQWDEWYEMRSKYFIICRDADFECNVQYFVSLARGALKRGEGSLSLKLFQSVLICSCFLILHCFTAMYCSFSNCGYG